MLNIFLHRCQENSRSFSTILCSGLAQAKLLFVAKSIVLCLEL